jgi:hypothetical protein
VGYGAASVFDERLGGRTSEEMAILGWMGEPIGGAAAGDESVVVGEGLEWVE